MEQQLTRAQRKRRKPSSRKRQNLDSSRSTQQLNYLYKKYKGICQLCFRRVSREDASRDHVKDLALCTKEEARDINNMVLAHVRCNNGKNFNYEPHLTYKIGDLFPELTCESN